MARQPRSYTHIGPQVLAARQRAKAPASHRVEHAAPEEQSVRRCVGAMIWSSLELYDGGMAGSARDRELSRQIQSNRNSHRHLGRYSEHRRRLTELVLTRCAAGSGGRLCVLGAGNCQDLELEQLAAHFGELHLVDLDPEALLNARARQSAATRERLTLHAGIELSQMLDQMDLYRSLRVAPEAIAEHPSSAALAVAQKLGTGFDCVLSACVLSQMQHALLTELGDSHRLFPALSYTLTLTHLRTLAALTRPGGHAILATDAATEQMAPLARLGSDVDWLDLLRSLAVSGDLFTSLNPLLLSQMLLDDPVLAKDVNVRPITDAWLWQNSEQRLYLVYALLFEPKTQ